MSSVMATAQSEPSNVAETEDELQKTKTENTALSGKEGADSKRVTNNTALSRTMEDIAKKYREINLNDDFTGDNDDDDDDELLNSEDGSQFGDFEGASELGEVREQQTYGVSTLVAGSGATATSSYRQTSSTAEQTDDEDDRRADSEDRIKEESSGNDWISGGVTGSSKRSRAGDRASICSSVSAWTSDNDYLRRLEADQEELSGSLLALTSHFAQVQFRLKQVKAAPPAEKERLLNELETLAFRGVPDLRAVNEEEEEEYGDDNDGASTAATDVSRVELGSEPGGRAQGAGGARRKRAFGKRQTELIEQLKTQLTDLEQLAYESGELSALPTAKRLHNQQVLMERLQQRLAVRGEGAGAIVSADAAGAIGDLLGDLERVPAEESDFDMLVERAVGAILNPVRVKEKVVDQLKTQIVDLERFIEFLQNGGAGQPPAPAGDPHAPGCPLSAALSQGGNAVRLPGSLCSCTGMDRNGRRDHFGTQKSSRVGGNANSQPFGDKRNRSSFNDDATGRSRSRRGDDVSERLSTSGSRSGRASGTSSFSQSSARQGERGFAPGDRQSRGGTRSRDEKAEVNAARNVMKRIAGLVHIFVLTNLACMNREGVTHSASSKASAAAHVNTVKEHHYGQMLARLQVLVDRVCQLAAAESEREGVTPTASASVSTAAASSAAGRLRDAPTKQRALEPTPNPTPSRRAHGNQPTFSSNTSKLQLSLNANSDADASATRADGKSGNPDSNVAYASDEEECYLAAHEHALTALIRKQLIPVVRDLLEHGLRETRTRSRVPAIASCFTPASASNRAPGSRAPTSPTRTGRQGPRQSAAAEVRSANAWQLFARYYELKGGRQWNAQPARNLSAAFAIDVVGGRSVSAKHTLLAAIDRVLALHSKFKRSDDAKLKALLCLALNERRVVQWLRLIVHNQAIVEEFFEPWSYVALTGFEDALSALSRLQAFTFYLPFDLAVRQLQNIKDAF